MPFGIAPSGMIILYPSSGEEHSPPLLSNCFSSTFGNSGLLQKVNSAIVLDSMYLWSLLTPDFAIKESNDYKIHTTV